MNAKDVFLDAIEIDDIHARRAFVDRACGDDTQLRQRVDALLAAHDDPESYLARPAAKFDVTQSFRSKIKGGQGLSDSSSLHGQFLPGTKIADRYRIVSLLGRGGMGEVYRADDLRLGQAVALKFLPTEIAKDKKRLDYFHNEVKLARQISHPNVCRVYDIGEVDGQHFISMEYVDGEDLKALLKRIGRLPKDKAIEISQQLCSALSAAHAKGVLHRDLKPANIMVDGNGQVRITDFGLAAVAGEGGETMGMSGTPAYMAPEQLLLGRTSVQSDLYSLGLVLFELSSGKPLHNAGSPTELRRFHESSGSKSLSDVVDDADPALDRAISRCLDADPANRPKSITELAAALPGGDPLAAALAAGETPSPELVAASGGNPIVSPRAGLILLATVVVGLGTGIWISQKAQLVNRLQLPRHADTVFADRADRFLRRLGFPKPLDVAYGFEKRDTEIRYPTSGHEAKWRGFGRREKLSESNWPGLRFWYRESKNLFAVDGMFGREVGEFVQARVRSWLPQWIEPGMLGIEYDHKGNLRLLRSVPVPSTIAKATPVAEPDWSQWFTKEDLGFDLASLQDATWERTPTYAFDRYKSWEGAWPESDVPLFVHAASYRGKPVMFEILSAGNAKPEPKSTTREFNQKLGIGWLFVAFHLAIILIAYRNWKLGIGDRKSAFRIFVYVFMVGFLSCQLQASHHLHPEWVLGIYILALGVSIVTAIFIWTIFTAFEPFVRRFCPTMLVSLTRVLRGQMFDSLVGRDVLYGCSYGVILGCLLNAASWMGIEPLLLPPDGSLDGARIFLGKCLDWHLVNAHGVLGMAATIVVVRAATGRIWPAYVVAVIIFWLMTTQGYKVTVTYWGGLLVAIHLTILAMMLVRYGLLFGVVALTVEVLFEAPLTTHPNEFYFSNTLIVSALICGLAYYGFHSATGRVSIWQAFESS